MSTPFPTDRFGFVLSRDVRAAGREAELRTALKAGTLHGIRRGVYAPAEDPPAGLSMAERDARRYRRLVEASATQLERPIFTSWSAVALAGLPIVGRWPEDVFVLSEGPHGRRRPGLAQIARPSPVATTVVDGLRVTTLPFTLLQVARRGSLAAALTATDAALRRDRFGRRPSLVTLDEIREEHERLGVYPGRRRAEAVLVRATTLSDGALETVSRLTIEECGFAEPELQHPIELDDGTRWLDFYWPDVGVAGEADGLSKYGRDAARGMSLVIAEKVREDALRERVSAFVRWGWDDVWRSDGLRTKLLAAGVPLTRRPGRLL